MTSETKAVAAVALLALGAVAGGCDTELAAALDEVRAAVPEVCKDYCEDRLTCTWPSADGAEEDAAYSAEIRRCTIDCAFFMDEGAYLTFTSQYTGDITYKSHVSGNDVEDALSCAFELGAFNCSEGVPADTYALDPLFEAQCQAAAECLAGLGIDYTFTWQPTAEGGVCVGSGGEGITAPFFL